MFNLNLSKMKKVVRRIYQNARAKFAKINNKAVLALGAIMTAPAMAMASGTFDDGIQSATNEITDAASTLSTLCLAIGAVVGLVGAVRIYIKWNNGDQDVTKAILGWGGAALFLIASGAIISGFFGVTV